MKENKENKEFSEIENIIQNKEKQTENINYAEATELQQFSENLETKKENFETKNNTSSAIATTQKDEKKKPIATTQKDEKKIITKRIRIQIQEKLIVLKQEERKYKSFIHFSPSKLSKIIAKIRKLKIILKNLFKFNLKKLKEIKFKIF